MSSSSPEHEQLAANFEQFRIRRSSDKLQSLDETQLPGKTTTSTTGTGPNINTNSTHSHRRRSSLAPDPDATSDVYYGKERKLNRTRTYSVIDKFHRMEHPLETNGNHLRRRASGDDSFRPQKFLINVDSTLKRLLDSEDTDKNFQITVEDQGPKVLDLGTVNSNGYNRYEIRGTYMLSNLLQELTLAKKFGRKNIVLDEARLNENPVKRLHRLISKEFWKSLTRRIDEEKIDVIAYDPKNRSNDPRPRIYVPSTCKEQYEYYCKIAAKRPELELQVEYLPENITPDYVKSIRKKPGLLALATTTIKDYTTGEDTIRGVPYVVPGGRFNEFYGWDSYMIALGLIQDDRIDLAKGIVINFCFEIKHYGKILNANRSYYLCRSQPPFLTDIAIKIYELTKDDDDDAFELLQESFRCAIAEYNGVWAAAPRRDPETGLSRYRPESVGIPPETEPSHFLHILTPYAEKYGVTFDEFQELYNTGKVHEPELDEYFLHDQGVRESGHDTTYRFEGCCADLATIDLNSLVYKYETDIAYAIKTYFGGKFKDFNGTEYTPEHWEALAEKRKAAINEYLWNDKEGMFFDYNTKTKRMITYESVTTFWPMWSKLCSKEQAARLVKVALPKFEMYGGLVSGTLVSRGVTGLNRPSRQWDYPSGWAPQQILAWQGLLNYGYHEECERIVYRWLFLITKSFVDYNGIVVEKYDVTSPTEAHKVSAEYGNQGLDFKGVATEGFGWVNASYNVGLSLLSKKSQRILGALTPPDVYFSSKASNWAKALDDGLASENSDENSGSEGKNTDESSSSSKKQQETGDADEYDQELHHHAFFTDLAKELSTDINHT